MTPKISVIVPVYNVEKYLPRCIDSILSQTFTDFELLLIDDGSPDNSGQICDEYAIKDCRVKVIHKQNGGVSSARNVGIENAKGEWITFIDADDYIEQGFLSIPEDAAEDLLIQNYRVQTLDELKNVEFEKRIVTESDVHKLINDNIVKLIYRVPWSKFFRKSIIVNNKLSYIEGIKIGEDTLFVLDYLRFVRSIKYHCEANYVYQKYGNTSIKYRLPVNKCLEILNLIIQRYDNLHAYSVKFLSFVYYFFMSLISPHNYVSLFVWHNNKTVVRICKVINVDYGIKWALKYALHMIKQWIIGNR